MPTADSNRANQKLLRAIRAGLRDHPDPAKAPIMQAYMKSAMPYLGIQTPVHRRLCRDIFRAHPLDSFGTWRDTILTLWRDAGYREERYAAIALAAYPPYRDFRTLRALPLYKELITTGAWWDYVDAIATRQIAEMLRKNPARMSATLREWATNEDIWLRRTAILAQLNFKSETDLTLLCDCIEPSLHRPEFFLRKAIGWALRQYARTNPTEVLKYIKYQDRLSPLSRREALKHLSE
jgi:3-methyladenine DNA glycosylase AlkD